MTRNGIEHDARPLARALLATVVVFLAVTAGLLARRSPGEQAAATVGHSRCVNSFDPSCGTFYWNPKPAPDQPIAVTLSPATVHAVAGVPVRFDAVASDPDARIACHWFLYGDEQTALVPSVSIRKRYGRWVPPVPQAGRLRLTRSHTYATPGTYHVQFGAGSGDSCSSNTDPYGDQSIAVTTVTVVPR
ncbi:MAG: hypothetical protein ACXVP8_01830 [Actinomycetota bacterium]